MLKGTGEGTHLVLRGTLFLLFFHLFIPSLFLYIHLWIFSQEIYPTRALKRVLTLALWIFFIFFFFFLHVFTFLRQQVNNVKRDHWQLIVTPLLNYYSLISFLFFLLQNITITFKSIKLNMHLKREYKKMKTTHINEYPLLFICTYKSRYMFEVYVLTHCTQFNWGSIDLFIKMYSVNWYIIYLEL